MPPEILRKPIFHGEWKLTVSLEFAYYQKQNLRTSLREISHDNAHTAKYAQTSVKCKQLVQNNFQWSTNDSS